MVWRLLLRDLAQRAARQAVSEHLARATSQSGPNAARPGDPSEPCRVGFVFALGIESGGTEDLLQDARHTRGNGLRIVEGLLAGRRAAIIQSGVGQPAAARATATLIAGHRPEWIVSAGLAGGLHPDVARGDFVFPDAIVGSDGSRFTLGSGGHELRTTIESSTTRAHVGALLTTDRVIRGPAEKRALGEQHGALAVDMESLAVANVCAQERTRFLSARIISDAVDDELPREIEKLLDQKSAARRAGAALGAILNRPGSLSEMLKLKEQALVASDQLARVLERVVVRLESDAPQSSG